jgi:hypothetical protein
MGDDDRCSIGVCNNDRRYPEKILVRLHVSKFQFHGLPTDQKLQHIWHDKIRKGRQNYIESVKICSNHFEDGEHTFRCSVPTLLLTKSYVKTQQSLHRRCQTLRTPEDSGKKKRKVVKSETSLCDQTFSLSLASVQLTRDADVQFYTGLSNTNVAKTLFDHLIPKASVMHYWKGPRQTLKEAPMRYSMDDDPNIFLKPGPGRILKLEL